MGGNRVIPNLKLKKPGQQSSSKALFSFFFAFFIPLFFSETVNQSSLAWLLCVAKDDLGLLIFLPYLRNARITTEHNYVWLPGFCFVLFVFKRNYISLDLGKIEDHCSQICILSLWP